MCLKLAYAAFAIAVSLGGIVLGCVLFRHLLRSKVVASSTDILLHDAGFLKISPYQGWRKPCKRGP